MALTTGTNLQPLILRLAVTEDNCLPVDLLKAHTDLSVSQLKKCLDRGACWLERDNRLKRFRRIKQPLHQGDVLHLYYNPRIINTPFPDAKLVANEADYSIWLKPRGVYSQGSKWGDHCSITRIAEKNLGHPVFLVHRLDRFTRGLMLVAHSKSAAQKFSALFASRQVEKFYQATVAGTFPDNMLPLSLSVPIEGKPAETTILRIINGDNNQTTLAVNPLTGRKHQIRIHLANQGFPIIGDRRYGNGEDDQELMLEAVQLAFTCPFSGEKKCYSYEP